MKLTSFLLVLATLSLCLASPLSDRHHHKDDSPIFVVLADSEIKNNRLVSSLLAFGSAQVLGDACSSDQLFAVTEFKVGQIHEVSRWADKSKALYKFAVRHNHVSRAGLYIESKFTVQYLLSGGVSVTVVERSSITFSDYDIHYDESVTLQGAYKVIPSSQYRNSLIQELLGYGNDHICHQARHRNQLVRLPAAIANLDILSINKIAYRKLDDITYYRYDVCLGDDGHKSYNYKVDATFVVMLCRKSGRYAIVSVEYQIVDLIDNSDCDQSDYKSDSDCSDKSDSYKKSCDSDSSSDSDKDCSDSDSDKSYKSSRKHDKSDNSRRSDKRSDNYRTNRKSNISQAPKPVVIAAPANKQ